MATCTRCDASISFFRNLVGIELCSTCRQEVKQVLRRLHEEMMQAIEQEGIDQAFYDYIVQELDDHTVPDSSSFHLIDQLDYQKQLTDIRQGLLPVEDVDAILDTDEIAHYETLATYYKPNMQVKYIEGRLIATNKRLYFITAGRDSMRIDWNNVVNVNTCSGKSPKGGYAQLMQIQVSKGMGGGYYHLSDPELAVAIIATAVRLWKRHLVELKANPKTKGIPDHVKTAVFQRDGGQCVQCGYMGPYIEYDHIIPRSKGGPNTVQNIQLLCRQCNLKKSNRI